LIVGDGPFRERIVELIKEAKIGANSVMIGARKNIDKIFSIMSVYVAPSVNEGLGLSLLEAQSNYVPVVGFRTGGITDVIEHEVTGLLVEPFDTRALAGAIVRLIKDKELANHISRAAYKKVEEKFSLKNMAQNTINVYKEVMQTE
jgi:glycosyltransferase involved in cell wall biosynthesis